LMRQGRVFLQFFSSAGSTYLEISVAKYPPKALTRSDVLSSVFDVRPVWTCLNIPATLTIKLDSKVASAAAFGLNQETGAWDKLISQTMFASNDGTAVWVQANVTCLTKFVVLVDGVSSVAPVSVDDDGRNTWYLAKPFHLAFTTITPRAHTVLAGWCTLWSPSLRCCCRGPSCVCISLGADVECSNKHNLPRPSLTSLPNSIGHTPSPPPPSPPLHPAYV